MNFYYLAPYKVEGLSGATMENVWNWVKTRSEITLDVETTGLDPHTHDVIMLQLGDHQDAFAIDLRSSSREEILRLLEYIRDSGKKIIGHNLKFDWKMICRHYEVRLRNVHDTMTTELVLECGRLKKGFSLEALTARYLNFKYAKTNQLELFSNNSHVGTLNKSIGKEFTTVGDKPFSYEQFFYGLKDIEFTHKIYLRQLSVMASDRLYKACYLENMFMCVLGEMELNGFYLDVDKWTAQYEKNKQALDECHREILEYIYKSNIPQFRNFQLTLFDNNNIEDLVDINLGSSAQVIELCKALGIPTQVLDKEKSREKRNRSFDPNEDTDVFKDSVEEKHLKKYASEFEIIPVYLRYRKYLKAVTTYGLKFLQDHVNENTGRVHSRYWPVLDTGRMASRSPNLQNIPSEDKFPGFRQCFISPPGYLLVVDDYANQEGRILADLARELNMINFFNHGDGDLHSHTARLMFKVPVQKEVKDEDGVIVVVGINENLRQLAKILNFGIA